MSSKKSIIIKIIKFFGFALLFVYLFVHISYVFRDDLANTREHMAEFYGEDKNSLDAVIIGTSSTFSAFMPMELWKRSGITSYVLTTNVQLENTLPYTIREMKKYQNPQLLIIDTAPFLYKHRIGNLDDSEAILRYNIDGFKYSANRIDLINDLIEEDRLYYYLDILYYHDSYHPNLKYWNIPKHGFAKGYSNLHPECSLSWADEAADVTYEDIKAEDIMDEDSKDNWEALLNELENYDGQVLFFIGPVFRKDADWADRIAKMRAAVNESGYELLDLSTDEEKQYIGIEPDIDYSLDHIHYNSLSAQKITARLGEYLEKEYTLPNHRIDEGSAIYKKWSEDEKLWNEKLPVFVDNTNTQREEFRQGKDVTLF